MIVIRLYDMGSWIVFVRESWLIMNVMKVIYIAKDALVLPLNLSVPFLPFLPKKKRKNGKKLIRIEK